MSATLDAILAWYETQSRPVPEVLQCPSPLAAMMAGVVASNADAEAFGFPNELRAACEANKEVAAAYEWAKEHASQFRYAESIRRRPLGGRTPQGEVNQQLAMAMERLLLGPNNDIWRAVRDAPIYGIGEEGDVAFIYSQFASFAEKGN